MQNFHKTIPKTNESKPTPNKNTTQPTKQTETDPQSPVKIRKRSETKVKQLAPLSAPHAISSNL